MGTIHSLFVNTDVRESGPNINPNINPMKVDVYKSRSNNKFMSLERAIGIDTQYGTPCSTSLRDILPDDTVSQLQAQVQSQLQPQAQAQSPTVFDAYKSRADCKYETCERAIGLVA